MNPRQPPLFLLVIALLLVLFAAPARGAVGIEGASRHAAAPGEGVDLTVGCGFCFPPCHGPHGQPDRTCMPDTKALPPSSFPVSLVPIERAPKPHRCGPNAVCMPTVAAPPRHAPFSFLGEATGPTYARHPGGGRVPRYLLHFSVPDLPPGLYAYVLFCDVCERGRGGSLLAVPAARPWRLRVLDAARPR